MKRHFVSLFLLFLFTSCSFVFAQKITGTITGSVTDPSGAVVNGATVTVVNMATNLSRTAKTNDEGVYTFPELEPGAYKVTATMPGFKQVTQNNVQLHVSDITRTDFRLPVGDPGTQVEVQASGIQVETETGTLGNVTNGQQVRELPLNGRNFVQLTTLIPGAATGEGFSPTNKGLLAGVDISFSGAPSNANQWRVDGANNNDEGSQRTILLYPSIDSIEEFKILRNSYGPEYGGAGGAQVNLVTRGGTNGFHGDVYYFGRNDFLNAKDYFLGADPTSCAANPLSCRKQKLRRNDYGYTIGGPIKKDKIFFFWSEEWNKERRGQVRTAWVPTALEKTGNFSDLGTNPSTASAPCKARMPIDDTTGTYFPGNVIPANRVSPAGQAYLSQMPNPTGTDPCATTNWVAQVNIPLDWREENIRGDVNLTHNTTLMLKYTQDAWTNTQHGYEEGGLWGDQSWPAISDSWDQPGKMAVAKLSTTLGATAVNDFQFSWSANRINIAQAGDNPGLIKSITSAIPTYYPLSGKLHASALPEPICWCSTYFGQIGPWNNRQDLYSWKDDYSKVAGHHTFKTGVYYSQNAKDEEGGEEAIGLWGAGGVGKVDWGNSGNQYADTLIKGTEWGFNENQRNTVADIRWRDVEFYGGDSWKVVPRLTLEYGARWTFQQPEYLASKKWASFVPSAYSPALKNDPCNGILVPAGGTNTCPSIGAKGGGISPYGSLMPSNHHLIAPRLGFAWDVFGNGKFAIRGGAGQFFSRDPVAIAIRMQSANTPYAVALTGYRTLDGPLVAGSTLFDNGGGANPAAGGTPGQGLEQNTNVSNNWQWNLTTETQLTKNAKLELGWVALRGIHLMSSSQINQVMPGNRLAYIQQGLQSPTPASRNQMLPYSALTTGALVQWNHRGDSIYHSLQSMFTTKLGRNGVFSGSYTWSKNIADTTLSYVGTTTGIADTYNPREGRGPADFDRRHIFNASLVWNLPAMTNSNGFVRGLVGGWETNSIITVNSGPMLTISGSVGGIGNPLGVGNSNVTAVRPLRVAGQSCTMSGGSRVQYLNPNAFTFNGYALGTAGNSGPGQCAGPGTQDVDFAIDKNWNLPFGMNKYFGEKSRIQFRFESFNLLNHPMFRFNGNNLSYNVTNAQFTCNSNSDCSNVTSVTGTTLKSSANFGQVRTSSNLGNRQLQYALKLIF